jgi:hypothetical protein
MGKGMHVGALSVADAKIGVSHWCFDVDFSKLLKQAAHPTAKTLTHAPFLVPAGRINGYTVWLTTAGIIGDDLCMVKTTRL